MGRAQFGSHARKLRIRAGLSQIDVAKKLKLKSGQLVSNWERGLCYPPLGAFRELAALYKVGLKALFEEYSEHYKQDCWSKIGSVSAKASGERVAR